jgi:Reverse transcriptase (RNA-dependent DNA polymerase)
MLRKHLIQLIENSFIYNKLVQSKKLSYEELALLATVLDTNYLQINDGVSTSALITQTNGVRQGGCLSPFLFIYSINDINKILKKYPSIKILLYADDIVLLGANLQDIQKALAEIKMYLLQRKLKLNLDKCKIVKFRKGGKGRYKKDDILTLDGQKLEFISDFCYLGVVFQSSGFSFSKHILKRVKASYFAISKLTLIHKSSIETALKLFDLAISPIASYGIEIVWENLNKEDLYNLETVKSRFLKKVLGLSKYTKSRFTYKLANTDFFVNDLRKRFSLPNTPAYEKFLENKIFAQNQINPDFYTTPAMCNDKWKSANFDNRHTITRYACHGFHYILCKNKTFHALAKESCICELCNSKIGQYHFFKCKNNTKTLTQASKI